jgi:pimeloyl-ACP methyl ester carboxylesterase
MDNPEMIRARGDGIDIQLALWNGEGRAALCVHGLAANCRCWDLKEVKAADYYPRIECPVLILHATEGTLSPDDRVLPESAVDRMLKEIPDARCVPVNGANHCSILFQPTLPEMTPSIISPSRLNP